MQINVHSVIDSKEVELQQGLVYLCYKMDFIFFYFLNV